MDSSIENQIVAAISNFELCERLCDFLIESHGMTIPTRLQLVGHKRTVIIPGENSGHITTPLVHIAMLDVRRVLAFLGLTFSKQGAIIVMPAAQRRPDDYWVGDLGLPQVEPNEVEALSRMLLGRSAENLLKQPIEYSNKTIAHFSKTAIAPEIDEMRDAFLLMRSAIRIFVYDRLSLPMPESHLKP